MSARSILVESIENILNAAAVESAKASVSKLLEIRFSVRSSVVALEWRNAVSQSQSPRVPLKPARNRVVFLSE